MSKSTMMFMFIVVVIVVYLYFLSDDTKKKNSGNGSSIGSQSTILDQSIEDIVNSYLRGEQTDLSQLQLDEVSSTELRRMIEELQAEIERLEREYMTANTIEFMEVDQDTDVKNVVIRGLEQRVSDLEQLENELENTNAADHETWYAFSKLYDPYGIHIENIDLYNPPSMEDAEKGQLSLFGYIANSDTFLQFTNYDGGSDIRYIVQYLDLVISDGSDLFKYILDLTSENQFDTMIGEIEKVSSSSSTENAQKQLLEIVFYLSVMFEQCVIDIENCKTQIIDQIDPKHLSNALYHNLIFALFTFYKFNLDNVNAFVQYLNPNANLLTESILTRMRGQYVNAKMSPTIFDTDNKITNHLDGAPINIVFFRFMHYLMGFTDNSGLFIRLAALFDGLLESIIQLMLSLDARDCEIWFGSALCGAISSQMFDMIMELLCMLFKNTSEYITKTIKFLMDTINACAPDSISKDRSPNMVRNEIKACIGDQLNSGVLTVSDVDYTMIQALTKIHLVMYNNLETFAASAPDYQEDPPLMDQDGIPSTDINIYKYYLSSILDWAMQTHGLQSSSYYENNLEGFTEMIMIIGTDVVRMLESPFGDHEAARPYESTSRAYPDSNQSTIHNIHSRTRFSTMNSSY